jgi:ppGpp synthetase/RelA/SpoT-type nucleotidyltranferase
MTDETLKMLYQVRYDRVLIPIARKLEDHLRDMVKGYPRIDQVSVRAKSVTSFVNKAMKQVDGRYKYDYPLNEIQDQVGARIVPYYLGDIEGICKCVEAYFGPIEKHRLEPEGESEFGYEGYHYVLFIPRDLLTPDLPAEMCPRFF